MTLKKLVLFGALGVMVLVAGAAILLSQTAVSAQSTTPPLPVPSTGVKVSEVPSVIPATGVEINNQVVLMPPNGITPNIDESQAIQDASAADNPNNPSEAMLTLFTLPESIPLRGVTIPFRTIDGVPAWVVTFTESQPIELASPVAGSTATFTFSHHSVAINAMTGQFVAGFFTK